MADKGKDKEGNIVVKTEGLVKFYGKNKALNGLSMNVPERAIYGLVGPNGAGKTTTLGILSTFIRPNSGSVEIYGNDIIKEPEKIRGLIGILPQRAEFYANRTALDIMTFYSKLAGLNGKEAFENADRLLDKVGMTEHKDKKMKEMSHGMFKLMGIAQTLIGNPKIIMLDEATSGLDPKVAYNIRKLVRELKKDTTIIFSSHNLYEVEDLCDYVGIIHNGKIIAEGRTKSIVKKGKSLEKVFMEKMEE
ncbi:multidrug ABC transporter ATP-binding protein [Candidatus Woesearchaeota archaeon CG10_big_fil_rev_8_21_14_0_10_44_13]|nr:MAG: multidrug ABC transporter ATP-binding protein [Candidatus Woesearchaeota archaeon CG10_big_fil_rev_8_21_14_0_10_44_13]